MDFFQRLGNFFTGKGWVNDDEKRRREQQVQPQPQQSQPQQVQQPQLNAQPRFNTPWASSGSGSLGQLSQPAQPKVNLNPLQQVNQATQQLNINSQNNQSRPQVTVDDAPKMLTPEGQQDWANKQNKQIQIQNAVNQPIQQPKPQPTQQPQPQLPKPALAQPQAPKPQPVINPNIAGTQNSLLRMGIDTNPVHTAIQRANEEMNQYKIDQTRRQDIIDNKMRARGVSEPEILSNRQERIRLENEANAAADQARRSRNMADIVGMATAPARSVTSFAKGAVDGAGRTVGDTGDKLALAISDAMYGITGDEKYNKARQNIVEQGKQRNAQYDKQFGVLKKNNADVDVAYELGQSGQRLVQDLGTGVATAGVVPVVRQFAENAADFVTDANAHGKNTRDVLGAAYANAAVQAAIEKVGLDKVLTPGGKTVARRMVKSALAEGGEEAAQQLTENAFAKHTYDPSRKYSEGVVKSALMGAALGGPAGAGNFGGVRQTGNHPSATMSAQIAQSQQTQQQTPGKLEQEALAQRQVRQAQNQDTGYSSFYRRPADNRSLRQAAEVSAVNTQTSQAHPIQSINVNRTVETTMPNASPALKQAVSRNISDIQHGDTNAIATRQQTTGKLENYLIEQATQNVQNTVAQDVRYKLSPAQEEYFKNSKIRDENGNLKTVYHGTNSEFDQFSPLAGSSSSTRNRWGEGNYLAYDKDMANDYGVNLKEMYANITSPITNNQKTVSFEQYDALYRRINNGEPAYREDYDLYDNDMDLLWDITDNGQWKKYAQDIKDTTGKDGVIMDDMAITFSPSQTKYIDNLNPTDGPDMRYKANSTARTELEKLQQSSELLARHLRLTGDERLVFNEWQNEMQRKALGYYNPKTDTINLNQLTEDTLNHELGHKILERADNKQELLDTIRESYGDDYLVSKYGKEYGDSDINLLAEEQLADGFSEYYNGKLHGEDAPRLAARLHIPQRIVAIYDRITEAIRGLIGKQDIIKQFYAQMETGKFRNTKQQVPGGDGRVRTMSLDSNKALETIKKFDEVLRGIRRITKLDVISNETAAKIQQATGVDVHGGASIELTNKNAIHIHNRHIVNLDDSLPLSDYDIAALPEIIKDPDTITKEKVVRGAQRIKFEREVEGNKKAIVEVIKKGNALNVVTYFNDSSSGRPNTDNTVSGYTSETGQLQSTNLNDSVANNTQNVNTDNRYQHPLQETINDIQDNPKPKMTKELREAIDNFIFENIDQNLFLENDATNIQGRNGSEWSIPRIHVDDLRHYLGDLTEDLPSTYKRRTGKRDIDTIAQEMGYDDIDSFISEVGRVAEARKSERERNKLLAYWRRDPDVIKEAQNIIDNQHAAAAREQAKAVQRAEEVKAHKVQLEKKQALDEVLTRGLDEGPRHKIADIIHNASLATGLDEKVATERFAQIAKQRGYDISGERAFLSVDPRAGSMVDDNGRLRPINEIAPNVKEKIKLPGVEHAVPAATGTANTETHNTRQMVYKDKDDVYHTFYEYRNIHGEWQGTGQEAVKVTSPLQSKFIDKIRSDKAVNEEAQRAYNDGLAIQYIWRENSKGVNAELVSAFDGYMKTGNKKEYRPSDKLVTFNPNKHYIESGRVVDAETGQILGNYIEMTPEGNVTIYAGKKKMNLNMRDVDLTKIKEMRFGAGQTWTTEGIIDRITGTLRRSNSLDYFRKGGNATKEALMSIMSEQPRQANAAAIKEGNAIGEQIKEYRKNLLKQAKKHGPLKRQMLQDAVFVIEPARPKRGEKSPSYQERLQVFEQVYGKPAAQALDQYNSFLRAVYKNLLIRQNEKRLELGKDPIMERKDYITHLGEMQANRGAIAAMFGGAKNLLSSGDMPVTQRQSLPAKLAGRTGLFKPSQKFNQFAMQRVGDTKPTDPFMPLMEYSKIALHNIHMTDAITMNRSLEVAVRAASEARQEFAGKGTNGIQKLADRVSALHNTIKAGEIDPEEITQVRNKLYGLERAIGREVDGIKDLHKVIKKIEKIGTGARGLSNKDINGLEETTNKIAGSLEKMLDDVNFMQQITDSANGLTQFVGFVQEHTNRLAGKTDPFERVVNDTEPSKMRKFTNTVTRGLMKQAALSKIVGNISSATAQMASLPTLVSTTSPKALLQAFKLHNRKAILQKSNALALRYADDNLTDDTKFEKTMRVAGIPMEFIEKNVIEYTFLAKYNQAINNGLSDADAVRYAERFINDTVTLRDQVSTPRAYNRLWSSAFLQFTREVSQQNRYVWNQMSGKQKVAFFVNTAILGGLLQTMTGNKPGVDPLGALMEIVGDWLDDNDDEEKDKSVQAKLERTLQKVSSETVSAVPIASAVVNAATTKDDRKKLFGKESNLGRYDGTLPAVSMFRSAIDTKDKLEKANKAREEGDDDKAEAKTKAAMYNLLGELPGGSQLKKTLQGIAAAHSGEIKDGSGNVKAEFDKDNPFYLTQGALFGKNALIPAQIENDSNVWINMLKTGGLVANASSGIQLNTSGNNNSQSQRQSIDNQLNLEGLNKKDALAVKKKLRKGDYQFEDGLLVNKKGSVERGIYKKLAEGQGESDEAYRNWMKAYNIDNASTTKKEFNSSNSILDRLQNGEKKINKAKSAVDILMGKYKDLPSWVRERYYKESGYSKEQIEYGAMTTHKEVSLMDNYWRQKAQESSHEELMQALTNGRRKSITGQMFAKNGVINKLHAEGYITKQEARALNAAQFDVDGNRITKEGSVSSRGTRSGRGGSSRGGYGRVRNGGKSSAGSGVSSIGIKAANISSSAAKANQTSVGGMSINQIGQNLISKMNTQKQVNAALKQWNGAGRSKKPKVRTGKA